MFVMRFVAVTQYINRCQTSTAQFIRSVVTQIPCPSLSLEVTAMLLLIIRSFNVFDKIFCLLIKDTIHKMNKDSLANLFILLREDNNNIDMLQ